MFFLLVKSNRLLCRLALSASSSHNINLSLFSLCCSWVTVASVNWHHLLLHCKCCGLLLHCKCCELASQDGLHGNDRNKYRQRDADCLIMQVWMGKVTTFRALRIHQGKKKKESEEKGIQHPCTAPAPQPGREPQSRGSKCCCWHTDGRGRDHSKKQVNTKKLDLSAPQPPSNRKERARKKAFHQVA